MESELGYWGILNSRVMSDGRKLGRLKSIDTAGCASDENRIIWMRQCHHKARGARGTAPASNPGSMHPMYSNSVQIGGQGAIFFPNIRTVVEDTGEGRVSIVAANEPLIPLSVRHQASCLHPIIHPSTRERPRNSPTLATKQPLTVHLPLGLLQPNQHESRALRR